MPPSAADYRPRDAEHAVLYRVIAENLEAFLETAKRHADGSSLPEFVEQEFRDFLTCGRLAHGFARLRCADCAVEGGRVAGADNARVWLIPAKPGSDGTLANGRVPFARRPLTVAEQSVALRYRG